MKFYPLLMALIQISSSLQAQPALQQADALLQKHYRSNEPGAAVLILQNGQPVFKKCYGVTHLQQPTAITAATNFNIASLTKQFTAIALLQLVAGKQLSLSDPASKYLPQLNHVLSNRVTLRHLLMHSSGVTDHYNFTDTGNKKYASDRDVLAAVQKTDSLYFPPGSRYRYSNTAYCLLALIIEKVSGKTYAAYIQKNIFEPLNMKHSTVLDPAQPVHLPATGYRWEAEQKMFYPSGMEENFFFSTQGDGGIYTSLDDYSKWLTALQQGKIIPVSYSKEARSPQQIIDAVQQLSYGYGWFISEKEKPVTAYHTGSNGGFRSIVITQPATGYALVIFSNRTDIDLEVLAEEINRILRVGNKSLTRLDSFISFQECWPIFAPCKKILNCLTCFAKNWNVNAMVLN